MDKPLFDSDADPKRIKKVADGLRRQGEFESARMLDSYADLLEAQEKAMPVGYVHKGYLDRDCLNEELYVTRNRVRDDQLPLYTHSAPSDADRLAEALRELVVACEEHDAMVSRIIGHPAGWNAQYLNSARQALAAHSAEAAQAQAQTAEPVGEVVGVTGSVGEMRVIRWRGRYSPEVGTKLYTHPQPAQDAFDPERNVRPGDIGTEPAQDAKDAARYRWLRDKSGRAGSPYIRCDDPPFKPMDYWITAGTADSCIDRAMAKESGR